MSDRTPYDLSSQHEHALEGALQAMRESTALLTEARANARRWTELPDATQRRLVDMTAVVSASGEDRTKRLAELRRLADEIVEDMRQEMEARDEHHSRYIATVA